uniref:Protein FAM161A n=1 Tax=Electrophorus electricus TaxID=8005 RepID=A0AAY5F187_ELEEL
MGDDTDLPEVQFSNEEYYCKLAQLKKAHHCTMAELKHMLRRNLQLRGVATPELLQWGGSSLVLPGTLKKTPSALELRRDSTFSDTDEECESDWKHGDYGNYSMKKGLLNSAKKHIKNMWRDFSMDTISPQGQQSKKQQQVKGRCRQVTVPKPFHMTLREAECKRKGVKSRSEIEWENGKLRQQLEELAECQRTFRAGPVPAHVYLPLFKELQEQREERRQLHHLQATEDQRLRATQRPFSFLERERARAEQKEACLLEQAEEERRRRRPFQAKPVPRAVREAAWGERQKEEELYRAIRMQMRAREMLRRSSLPPSAQDARPGGRRGQETEGQADIAGRRLRAGGKVPDFDGSYRRFQRQLVRRREVRPVTVCEPFRLCTANITSRRQRIAADLEADGRNPRQSRWPFVTLAAPAPRTPVCSSQDYLPAKITDSAKKRHEAVRAHLSFLSRKVLEQRKKVEEEEERWREKQKKKDRRLRKVIWKRAKAYDPHTTLAQTHQHKLREFRYPRSVKTRNKYRITLYYGFVLSFCILISDGFLSDNKHFYCCIGKLMWFETKPRCNKYFK